MNFANFLTAIQSSLSLSLSVCLSLSILDFIGAKDEGGGGDNWSYKTCQSNYYHQQTDTQLFTC